MPHETSDYDIAKSVIQKIMSSSSGIDYEDWMVTQRWLENKGKAAALTEYGKCKLCVSARTRFNEGKCANCVWKHMDRMVDNWQARGDE